MDLEIKLYEIEPKDKIWVVGSLFGNHYTSWAIYRFVKDGDIVIFLGKYGYDERETKTIKEEIRRDSSVAKTYLLEKGIVCYVPGYALFASDEEDADEVIERMNLKVEKIFLPSNDPLTGYYSRERKGREYIYIYSGPSDKVGGEPFFLLIEKTKDGFEMTEGRFMRK